jgi:hypothetical protein
MKKKILHFLVAMLVNTAVFAQNGAHILIASGPCNPIVPVLCPSGVENPQKAVDNSLETYATMRTFIGISSSSYLQIGWTNPAPSGYTVGVFTAEGTVVNAGVLSKITLTLYNSSGQQIAEKSGFSLADVDILDNSTAVLRIKVPKNATAKSVRITVGGLSDVVNDVRVYGAVYAPNNLSVLATYVFAEQKVLNSQNAVDANKNNYATLSIPLGINSTAFLDLGFTQLGTPGVVVGFVVGTGSSLIDVTVLSNLKITVYDVNGNVVATKNGFSLAEAQSLGNNKFLVKTKTPPGNYQIARARITLTSLVSVLSTVRVYNAQYKGKITFASFFKASDEEGNISPLSLELFPNPASNSINVTLNSLENSVATYEITNMVGQRISSGQIESGNTHSINTQMFENGLYTLRLVDNEEITSKNFIIQR